MEDGNRLRVDVVMMRVQYGWWNAVPSAVDAGLPINTGNSSRRETLLHMAAGFFSKHGTHECDLPTVRLLLSKGADPHARCLAGITPLWRAVVHGSSDTVAALVEAGADVNAATLDGRSPLLALARNEVGWSRLTTHGSGHEFRFGATPLSITICCA